MSKSQDYRQITAETAGKDLLGALVTEIKLLPDVWQKLSKAKQDDVIERLRARVEENGKMVVFTIASSGRTVVEGNLDKVTIKGNVEAVIRFGINTGNLPELFSAAAGQESKTVLVVVAGAEEYTQGMDQVKGEDDQRAMDLGHEYHDNDGGGMDKDENDRGTTIDGEVPRLPAPSDTGPTAKELDQAFDDGYEAAAAGKPESDCPVISGELVIEWLRGYRTFHAGKNAKGRKA